MVRRRSTRFSSSPTTTTPTTPTPTVTVTRTSRPPTVFNPLPQPPRPTTVSRPTTITQLATRQTTTIRSPPPPTVTRTSRPTSSFVQRSQVAQKRDDFQRSLSPLPVVRQAFAEESPRQQSQLLPVKRESVQQRSFTGRGTRPSSFVPVRTQRKDSISVVATPLSSPKTAQRQKFAVPFETQKAENQRLLDAGVPTFAEAERQRGLSERDIQIGSFGGGVIAEIQNLRSIVDGDVTPTREVGSLAIDLPFAVAGETFTRPSAEGEAGVLGLGFDFRSSPDFDAGFEKSGELQKEIGQKFEEDPARAVGSIFAVGAVEAGLLITTGGVGNLARRGIIQVGKQIATTKGRKIAEKVAREQPAAKKGIPQLVENLGDGRFAILQGFEEIGKRVGSIRVLKGGGIVTQTTTKSGKIIEKELDIITGITKTGARGKLKGKTIKVTARVEKQADVPLIIVDTKSRLVKNAVTGSFSREAPRTRFFNKNIPDRSKFLDDPELLNIVGADAQSLRIIGKQTGLKAVKGKKFALVSEGKIPEKTLKAVVEAEKFGQIRASARGLSVTTKDASSKKGGLANLIGQFAVKQDPLFRAVTKTKISGAEIREGIRTGAPPPLSKELTGIPFQFAEIQSARTVGGRLLSESVSPKRTLKGKPKGKGKKVGVATERVDDFNVLNPFGSSRPRPQRTVQVRKPSTRQPKTDTQSIFEAFTTPARKVKPVRVPLGARVAVGTIPTQVRLPTGRTRDDFAILQGDVVGQLPRQRTRQITGLDQGSFIGQPIPTRTVQTPILDRPVTTPFFRQDTPLKPRQTLRTPLITTFETPVVPPTTTFTPTPPKTPTGLGGGLPTPFFPPSDAEKRRRGTKKGRKSRLGGRLFDIADEPFGEVAVGLGFFVETQRGESSIEDALGIGDDDFEPITRQEKQARARLGKNGKGRRQENFAEGFDFDSFF